jgi:hypothetical protein
VEPYKAAAIAADDQVQSRPFMNAVSTMPDAGARLAWASRVLAGESVLVAGRGDDELASALAREGKRVSATGARVANGSLPFGDATFDSVLLSEDQLSVAGLEEVRRVAAPSGRIAVVLSPGNASHVLSLTQLFGLAGFEPVGEGLGLELVNEAPGRDAGQPAPQPPATSEDAPAELAALLRSARADRSRIDALEAERQRRDDELGRMGARLGELEREAAAARTALEAAGAELEAIRASEGSAEGELRAAQALAYEQAHRIAELQAAADTLRSQLAQAAEDARYGRAGLAPVPIRDIKAQAKAPPAAPGPGPAAFAGNQGSSESRLRRDLERARARGRSLEEEVAKYRRLYEGLLRSRGHRIVSHLWLLSRRRREVALKGGIAGLALIALVVALILGSAVAAVVLAVVMVAALVLLALELAGVAERRARRRARGAKQPG